MDAEYDLEKYKALLLARYDALMSVAETSDAAAGVVELDQSCVGRLSRMDALQAQAMSKESNRRREEALKRITAALRRIENGEYGYCLSCDELIPEPRLEFDPAATLCVTCADKH